MKKKYRKKYGKAYDEALRQVDDHIGDSLLSLYDLGSKSTLTEVLFMERCLRLLKKGGRMGMVLPEGVLNNKNLATVREYFEGRAKIILICSIPQDVFIAAGAIVKPTETRRVILDNCNFKAILGANDPETQELLCKMVGTERKYHRNYSEQYDEFGDSKGYGTQFSKNRDWRIPPHEFSSLKDVIFVTPLGVTKVQKFQCYDIANGLYGTPKPSSIIHAAAILAKDNHCDKMPIRAQEVRIAREVDYLKIEGDVTMMSVEERVQNANRRAEIAERNFKINARNDRELAQKNENGRYYAIGKLIVQFFPDLISLKPGKTQEETDQNFAPLYAILHELSSDREYITQLVERTGFRDQISQMHY